MTGAGPPDPGDGSSAGRRGADVLCVLLVEDNPADARLVSEYLWDAGRGSVRLTHADRLQHAVALLRAGGFSVVLLDLSLPDSHGISTFRAAQLEASGVPIVVLTGHQDEAVGATAVREGAQDYVVKGQVDGRRLHDTIRYAVERHRGQEALRDSEARYRRLVDSSIQGILIHVGGVIRLANPAVARLLGVESPTELLGASIWDYVAPDDRALVASNLEARMRRAGAPDRYEFRVVRRDGTTLWLDASVTTISWEGDEGVLVTVVDVTEQRRAAQALEVSERRFRQLADAVSDVFFIADVEARQIHFVSRAYEEICGRSLESLHRDPLSFLGQVLEEDRARVLDAMAALRSGADPGEVEFGVRRPDGEVRWIVSHAIPILDTERGGFDVSGIARDVTRRREAQLALEESEARFRKLGEASFDGMAVVLDGRIQEVNEGFARMFGYAVDDMIGRPPMDFAAPESREVVARRIQDAVEGTYEFVGMRKDGRRIIVEATAKSHSIQGRPGRVTALRDLTERRHLEESFRQAQKMEAIGRLAGGVAHDFNNSLTVILACAEVLLHRLPSDGEEAADVREIKEAAKDAAGLTQQLLAFSRKDVLSPQLISVNEVVARTERMLRRVIGEDLELVTALHPTPARVLADPGQMEQLLMNLAVNARDAMPEGGTLTIRTGELQVDASEVHEDGASRVGPHVLLSVVDTGAGMDEETLSHIFEPFFTTKPAGKGTGLGLASVYATVRQSGGFIRVRSRSGKGTAFEVHLPVADEDPPGSTPEPSPTPMVRGHETILVAEDAEAVRAVVQRVLERRGYTVLTALSGPEAMEVAAAHPGPIHLLLTDLVMPGMGGRELAERLRSARPEAKVLFMSGYSHEAAPAGGLLGASPFLRKPFTEGELSAGVRAALDGTA